MARIGRLSMLICLALANMPASGQLSTSATEASFDGDGYRANRYRAPVDRLPVPAQQISLLKALQLHQRDRAMFIDVAPVESGYRDPATGVWRLSQTHITISGAAWHPETGRTHPDPELWHALLRAALDQAKRRPSKPIIVFCRSDCWMGWNAARRLAKEGAPNVYWLAEGVDGWHESGRKLVGVQPVIVVPKPLDKGAP